MRLTTLAAAVMTEPHTVQQFCSLFKKFFVFAGYGR